MTALITIIHVFVCFVLIIVVLLQSGKSADLAGAFGGGGSQSAFGPRGAQTILSKMTTICAVLFMFTSIGLWLLSSGDAGSVLQDEQAPITEKAAATTDAKKAGAVTEKKPPAQTETTDPSTKKKAPEKKDTVPEKK